MDNNAKLEELAAAERHVAQCNKNIANQRAVIAELERDGHDNASASAQLREFEEVQGLYARDLERLRKELGISPA